MNIFDFNIHLPYKQAGSELDKIPDETGANADDVLNCYAYYVKEFKENFSSCNFMLLNPKLFGDAKVKEFILKAKKDFANPMFTSLADFRNQNILEYLEGAFALGVGSVKFHSYVQKIEDRDFPKIIEVCRFAQSRKKIICIDASYGSTGMYRYDNLKLAAAVADEISNIPVVILHSGGARVFEAMLLAEEKKNILLETSFSINYYAGSSLEQDFAFAYRKIGSERIIYGSDFPYVSLNDSIETITSLLGKHRFKSNEIENILGNNAVRLINDL